VSVGGRLQRLLVAAYPPSFRHRYGDELASLVEDSGSRGRDSVDLALGMCRAWVAPVFDGAPVEQRRSRLQTTTVTVLAAWCASLLAGADFAKSVDDPPLPGLHGVAGTAYNAGGAVLKVTAVAVLVGGFVFWLTVMVPAVRARRRDIVVPALAPALVVAAWLGVTGLVALFAHHWVPGGNVALSWPRGAVALVVLLAWGAVTVVCVAGCAASAAVALRRARVSATRLASSTVVAGLAAVGVAVQAVASIVCLGGLVHAGGGLDPRDAVFSTGDVGVFVVATAIAAVSVARGLSVLRPGPPSPVSPTS
jgi:hypothetical protein